MKTVDLITAKLLLLGYVIPLVQLVGDGTALLVEAMDPTSLDVVTFQGNKNLAAGWVRSLPEVQCS